MVVAVAVCHHHVNNQNKVWILNLLNAGYQGKQVMLYMRRTSAMAAYPVVRKVIASNTMCSK